MHSICGLPFKAPADKKAVEQTPQDLQAKSALVDLICDVGSVCIIKDIFAYTCICRVIFFFLINNIHSGQSMKGVEFGVQSCKFIICFLLINGNFDGCDTDREFTMADYYLYLSHATSGQYYNRLKQIIMVPTVFERLNFHCRQTVKIHYLSIHLPLYPTPADKGMQRMFDRTSSLQVYVFP